MKTFKELKDFCEKNNVRYEVNPIYSKPWYNPLKMEDERFILGFEMGMRNITGRKGKSEWQWVWFETCGCPEELTDEQSMMFRERYSQVNGKSYRGFRERWRVLDTIERRS